MPGMSDWPKNIAAITLFVEDHFQDPDGYVWEIATELPGE
jgi:predicted lactoylglutathione lyase